MPILHLIFLKFFPMKMHLSKSLVEMQEKDRDVHC